MKTPTLIGLNLVDRTIIISSDKYCEGFDMFIAKIKILIEEVKVSPIQTEITFISNKFAAIVYTYLLKETQLGQASIGISFKEDLPEEMKKNLTALIVELQQLIATSSKIAFKTDFSFKNEVYVELASVREEIQILNDLIKSQALIVFKKLSVFGKA